MNGVIPCLAKLGEIRSEIFRSAPTETKSTVKIVSDALACILVRIHSATGDWGIGLAVQWEWGRIVGIVFINSVDPDSFIANVVRRHAITRKEGAFTIIDDSKFDWHMRMRSRSMSGIVLSAAECEEMLGKAREQNQSLVLSLLPPKQAQVLIPMQPAVESPCVSSDDVDIRIPRAGSGEGPERTLSDIAVCSAAVNSTRNAFAKYHSKVKKKVKFSPSLISYILVPKLSTREWKGVSGHELFYNSLDYVGFVEDSDRELARKISQQYKLSKRLITVKEARKLLYQPEDAVLYDNTTRLLEEVALGETGEHAVSGDEHSLGELSAEIRKRSVGIMTDDVDRKAIEKKYGSRSFINDNDQKIADIIIPQSKNNAWYVSKYLRLAYRKVSHKRNNVGGGIAETNPLVALRHGTNIVTARNVHVRHDTPAGSYECDHRSGESVNEGMPFNMVLQDATEYRRRHQLDSHHEIAYASYMLGSRLEPPFFVNRPSGGDITSVFITVIGCKNLKSPFVRLLPRPVNSYVEVKIANKSVRTDTKHTDLNPIYDSNTTFLFRMEGAYQEMLTYDNGVVQLAVYDSCFSTTKIGTSWISLSSVEFSADEYNPTLLTVPITTGTRETYFSVRQNEYGSVSLSPIATTTATDSDRSHNDMLIEHSRMEDRAGNAPQPTVSVLISKVNPVLFWMLEELRLRDEEQDNRLLADADQVHSEVNDNPREEGNDGVYLESGYEFDSWFP